MMSKTLRLNAIAAVLALTTSVANAAVFIKYENIDGPGDVDTAGWPDNSGEWFVANSFSFGVEREMKESGEKGGTADINIGVGELQEVNISKSVDVSTTKLAQLALTGRSLGKVEMCITQDDGTGGPQECYIHVVMERSFVRSWSTSGDADNRPTEEVAIYYNKIAFSYVATPDGVSWNNEKNRPWPEGCDFLLNAKCP
jgi:type VI secretion system secreted protein Hcp